MRVEIMETVVAKQLNLLIKKDFYSDGAWWVAQCVEYDVVCQARTPKGLLDEFARTLATRLALAVRRKQADPFLTLRPAPEEIRRIFEHARLSAFELALPQTIEIPGISAPVGVHAQLAP